MAPFAGTTGVKKINLPPPPTTRETDGLGVLNPVSSPSHRQAGGKKRAAATPPHAEHLRMLSKAIDASNQHALSVLEKHTDALKAEVGGRVDAMLEHVLTEQQRALHHIINNPGKVITEKGRFDLTPDTAGFSLRETAVESIDHLRQPTTVSASSSRRSAGASQHQSGGLPRPFSAGLSMPGLVRSLSGGPQRPLSAGKLRHLAVDKLRPPSSERTRGSPRQAPLGAEIPLPRSPRQRSTPVPARGNAQAWGENEASEGLVNDRSKRRSGAAKRRTRASCGQDMDVALTEMMPEGEAGEEQPKKKPADEKRGVFVGASEEAMKEKVRVALVKPQYNVQDYYFDSGVAQLIARSSAFEFITICVIAINTFWLAYDADYNDSANLGDAKLQFQIAEHSFCIFFTLELAIRYMAFRRTVYALQDMWFMYDFVLVMMMIGETWVFGVLLWGRGSSSADTSVLKVARMARLTRMARMVRLLKWMPELVVLLKGLGLAARSVFFTLLLLTVVIYVFALTFKQLTASEDYRCDTCIGKIYFDTVPSAFASLMLQGTLPDLAQLVYDVAAEDYALAVLLVFFILFASVTIMNMLIGVLVEVVSMVSTIENETIMVNMVRMKMLTMIDELGIDEDGNGMISKDEFERLLINADAAQFMQEVGVDVVGLVEFSDFIFKDRELAFYEFVELILQLRGSNTATVKDLVDLRRFIMMELDGAVETLSSSPSLPAEGAWWALEEDSSRAESKDPSSTPRATRTSAISVSDL